MEKMYLFRNLVFVIILQYIVLDCQGFNILDHKTGGIRNSQSLKENDWDQHHAPRFRSSRSTRNEEMDCERPNIYFCELPPEVVPADSSNTCNYRNMRYHEQVYRWVAGRGCLLYTRDSLYVGGSNPFMLNAGCFYENLYAPCMELAKEDGTCGCYPFDPNFPEVAGIIRDAMVPAAQDRWERCYQNAADCCVEHMVDPYEEVPGCEATYDGWTCWHASPPDTNAYEVCSEFAYSNTGPSCNHYSYKTCYGNSTWELQTDYSTCSITPRLLRRYHFHIAMLSFSIASSLPAVCVFFFYRRLRVTRVALHRNLLIAIIVRNILVITSRIEIYIDEVTNSNDTVLQSNGIPCRVLAVAERVAGNMVFICMMVEGIYLHRLIVGVFRRKANVKILYAVGTVFAIIPALVWTVLMQLYNNHSCWVVFTVEHIQWILDGPRLAILVINTVLFVDVLRVLLTKLNNPESINQLNTTKATLFLMPMFGIQFFFTAFRPNTDNCNGEQIFYYLSYTMEGFQGFIVALLYCYINKEVHMLLKATYRKTENVVSRIRGDSEHPRMSLNPNSEVKTTVTGVSNKNISIQPNLHVAEIISLQASERLAEILEPMYETLAQGILNVYTEGEAPKSNKDGNSLQIEDYEFTNASSDTIECKDWLRCPSSPTSSVYNSSNTYETHYIVNSSLEKKESDASTSKDVLARDKNTEIQDQMEKIERAESNTDSVLDDNEIEIYSDYNEDMLDEIINYMESKEIEKRSNELRPSLLCPNRNDNDQVVFIE